MNENIFFQTEHVVLTCSETNLVRYRDHILVNLPGITNESVTQLCSPFVEKVIDFCDVCNLFDYSYPKFNFTLDMKYILRKWADWCLSQILGNEAKLKIKYAGFTYAKGVWTPQISISISDIKSIFNKKSLANLDKRIKTDIETCTGEYEEDWLLLWWDSGGEELLRSRLQLNTENELLKLNYDSN